MKLSIVMFLFCNSCANESPLERNEKAVIEAMRDYVDAQKAYKSRNGTFARDFSDLDIPAEMAAAVHGEQGSKGYHGYLFALVPKNGGSGMDYRADFVLCAVPEVHGSTGRHTFGVGPKNILIVKDNQGVPILNAVEFADGTWKQR